MATILYIHMTCHVIVIFSPPWLSEKKASHQLYLCLLSQKKKVADPEDAKGYHIFLKVSSVAVDVVVRTVQPNCRNHDWGESSMSDLKQLCYLFFKFPLTPKPLPSQSLLMGETVFWLACRCTSKQPVARVTSFPTQRKARTCPQTFSVPPVPLREARSSR